MYMVAAVVEIMTAVESQYGVLRSRYRGKRTVVRVEHELGSRALKQIVSILLTTSNFLPPCAQI